MKEPFVPVEIIQNKIYLIRGHKVMLDRDLKGEFRNLMFQFGTSSWGGACKFLQLGGKG